MKLHFGSLIHTFLILLEKILWIHHTYAEEKKKALDYMTGTKPRVVITSDMWTSDNQRMGYMAVTAHFIDDTWVLRNIIKRYLL
jgi:hypothetical protein